MTRRILDVGNCRPDHATIRQLIQGHFQVEIDQVHTATEALQALSRQSYDLVLVNRVFDRDGDDGLEMIRSIKSNSQTSETPTMLISNFEDYQQMAISAGAVPGFGKAELGKNETLNKLRPYLA